MLRASPPYRNSALLYIVSENGLLQMSGGGNILNDKTSPATERMDGSVGNFVDRHKTTDIWQLASLAALAPKGSALI